MLKKLNICTFLLTSLFLLTLMTGKSFSDPNTLLGEAIKINSSINNNLPQKERLKAYKDIFKLTDKIISEHPASEQAIKLLSNQKVGDFDQEIIRGNYIKELTEFYDIVCETSPSFLCIGFVSLKKGMEACKSSNTVRSLVEAHQNIKNAINIFTSQQSDNSFINLSLDGYRNCLSSSKYTATDYSKDLFAIDLIEMLLNLAREEKDYIVKDRSFRTAQAMIQNMKTPAFKLSGVLIISEYQMKPFDRAFYDRLFKYIKEEIKDDNGSQASANLELFSKALVRGKFSMSGNGGVGIVFTNMGKYSKTCDPLFNRNLLVKVLKVQYQVATLGPSRAGYQKANIADMNHSLASTYPLNVCYDKKSDKGQYKLSTYLHANLLLISMDAATEFRRGVIDEDWTGSKQVNYTINVLGQHKELFLHEYRTKVDAELRIINEDTGSSWDDSLINFEILFNHPEFEDKVLMPVYKELVKLGDVCESSKMLFRRIKGKNYFDDAIEYMINSKEIDITKYHKCGDSQLELLLN